MIEVREDIESFRSQFSSFERGEEARSFEWLGPIRRAAIEHFSEHGFPSTREEEWRFTNVAPIARTPFRLAEPASSEAGRELLDRFSLRHHAVHEVVFVNGRFSPELSSPGTLPKGVFIGGLREGLASHKDPIASHLAQYAEPGHHAFAALNAAFFADGAFVFLAKGSVLETPVHLLFLSVTGGEPGASHPRNLLIAEANSQVRLVESYGGDDGVRYLTNAVTEIVADENAIVDHYKLQREGLDGFHVATVRAQLARDAAVLNHSVSLGGKLTRNDIHFVLGGKASECALNGLYMVRDQQHVDHHTVIDHVMPHATSRELYKGILDDRATAVFNGRIIVRPDAQKTDARQTNKNLLLSDRALVNTNPQLEINADDVKCSHGATIGQLDAEALFYMRSRGIGKDAARALLTYGFISELSGRIRVEPLRRELEKLLFRGLPQGGD